MATTSDIHGWPLAEGTDAADIEVTIGDLADDMDNDLVAVFADATARDAAIPTPSTAQLCVTNNVLQAYLGGSWFTPWDLKQPAERYVSLTDTTATDIAGLSWPVLSGESYIFRGVIFYHAKSSTPQISWSVPTHTKGGWILKSSTGNAASTLSTSISLTSTSADTLVRKFTGYIKGITADGTMQFRGRSGSFTEGIPDDGFVIHPGTFVALSKVQ